MKKVRGHCIIEPVTPLYASPSAGISQLLNDIPLSSLGDGSSRALTTSAALACDGPEFVRLFAGSAEIYEYLERTVLYPVIS